MRASSSWIISSRSQSEGLRTDRCDPGPSRRPASQVRRSRFEDCDSARPAAEAAGSGAGRRRIVIKGPLASPAGSGHLAAAVTRGDRYAGHQRRLRTRSRASSVRWPVMLGDSRG
jgi:hypothetical protein